MAGPAAAAFDGGDEVLSAFKSCFRFGVDGPAATALGCGDEVLSAFKSCFRFGMAGPAATALDSGDESAVAAAEVPAALPGEAVAAAFLVGSSVVVLVVVADKSNDPGDGGGRLPDMSTIHGLFLFVTL